MKKLLLFFLVFLTFFQTTEAQETVEVKKKNSFVEWNFGIAYIDEEFIFPGTSVLVGSTYISENNVVFEYEVGFALPTLVTGKIGVGKRFNKTNVVVGLRPFPFNVYLQTTLNEKDKGGWIVSIEYNPIDSNSGISFQSKGNLNFGYRWRSGYKKKNKD